MLADLKTKTLSGISWSAISQTITQAFTFGISVILARFLGPKAYGLVGMITVLTGLATVLGDLGLGPALIQRRELEPRHLTAAFWINVAMGTLMTLSIALLSPMIALFYHEPQLVPLTATLSFRFLIGSLSVVPIAVITKAIHFKTLAVIQILSTVAGGLLGVAMAIIGYGVWSLIAQTLSNALLVLVLSWGLNDWRPSFTFDRAASRELFKTSSFVIGFNIANYWERSFDQLLIGRSVGAAALGVYSRAYSLMLMPITQISGVIGKVMFPALSSIQDNPTKVRSTYLRVIVSIAAITFPMMTGAFAVSDHLVLAFLGNPWAPVIPIFQIFCWVGIVQSIGTTTGWLFLSQGKMRLYFLSGVVTSSLCMVAFLLGIRWGVIGVAWSYLVFTLLEIYPLLTVSGGLVELKSRDIFKALFPPFVCSVVMAVCVRISETLVARGANHWKHLMLEIPLGIVVYVSLIAGLELEVWQDGYRLMHGVIKRRVVVAAPARPLPQRL